MKCLSLWQPWATLMANGAKRIETRNWSTNYRGPLAIHAALHWKRVQREYAREPVFAEALKGEQILRGRVLCIVDLVDVVRTEGYIYRPMVARKDELDLGDYTPGRYAWITKNLRRLKQPIALKARQGLFDAPLVWCDGCYGTGLMEGWNRRDGNPCPKCKGDCIMRATV